MSGTELLADIKKRLATLSASLPHEECRSCECLQGLLTQLHPGVTGRH